MGQESKVYYDASRQRLYLDGIDVYVGVGSAVGATDQRGYTVVPRGTAALPSVSFRLAASPFTASPTTGLYAPAADQVAMSCAATQVMVWTSGGVSLSTGVWILPDGTAALPSLGFVGSPTTGLFRVLTGDILGVAVAGAEALRFSAGGAISQGATQQQQNIPFTFTTAAAGPTVAHIITLAESTSARIRVKCTAKQTALGAGGSWELVWSVSRNGAAAPVAHNAGVALNLMPGQASVNYDVQLDIVGNTVVVNVLTPGTGNVLFEGAADVSYSTLA